MDKPARSDEESNEPSASTNQVVKKDAPPPPPVKKKLERRAVENPPRSKDTSFIPSESSASTASTTSRDRANTAPAKVVYPNEDDEEIRMARAIALAISRNPNLTPEEIRELVGAPSSVINTTTKSEKPTSQISSRFSAMVQDFDNLIKSSAAAVAPTSSTSSVGVATSLRDNFRKYVVSSSTAEPDISENLAGLDNPSTTGKSHPVLNHTLSGVSTPPPLSVQQQTSVASTTTAASSLAHTSGTVRNRIPFRKSSPRSPPTLTESHGITLTSTESITSERHTIHTVPSEASSLESEVIGHGLTAREASSSSSVMNILPPSLRLTMGAGSAGNVLAGSAKSPTIRLSTLAWKRRGGMGKYATLAWELRRIELVGTRILYYRNDADDDQDAVAKTGAALDGQSYANDDQHPDGVVLSRRSNWLEQAAATLVTQTGTDPTSPRGFIDLAKEKATVNAAFGHSGAPSPFAISIKVRGETKWKLCFDYHKTMMEWLAAITDVVVQASLDSYNSSLLAAADPSNASVSEAATIFTGPVVNPPPAPDGAGADQPHRLWMMDSYVIEGGYIDKVTGTEDESNKIKLRHQESCDIEWSEKSSSVTPLVSDRDTQDHAAAREMARKEAEITSCIPEENLWYLGVVVNASLLFARSSSTSIEGFWYLIVATNLAMLLLSLWLPRWDSILERVRDLSTPASTTPATTYFVKEKETITEAFVAVPEAEDIMPKFKPPAGCSTVKLKNPSDPAVNGKNQAFAGWCTPSPEIMLVRSHGYLVTKAKIPSPGELYECVQVDIFESAQRYPDMGTRVKLPAVNFSDRDTKTWRMPDLFVVSIALPTDPPKFGRASSDGGGYTVTVYFRMHQETRDILRRVTADNYDPSNEAPSDPQASKVNAVRLMEEWCRRAPTDPKYQARFKVVPNAHNLDEIGMPTWIAKYNGKPFLVKMAGQTGFLYSHPELSCMEFDVSLHPFPYLAKQAICFMKETYFKRILVSFGFCIEGRADDELPECLIGAVQLCYPDPSVAIQAKDFFTGRSPNSFD